MERIGASAFDGERLRRTGTWGVAFLADWCPFCRSFEPEFEELRADEAYHLAVADLTDESSPLWDRFAIEIVPTVIVFRDGATVFRRDGISMRGLGESDLRAIRGGLARP